MKGLHPFWAHDLLDCRAWAKNTAEGADALPSLLSCPQQESDLEVSFDHGATQPSRVSWGAGSACSRGPCPEP